jgi:hypothetical protein
MDGEASMETRGPADRDRELIVSALQIRADIDAFEARWPALPPPAVAPPPSFAWEALERQLVELAPSDLQAELVRGLVARVRAYAELKPPEMVLRQILSVAALVLEDNTPQSD